MAGANAIILMLVASLVALAAIGGSAWLLVGEVRRARRPATKQPDEQPTRRVEKPDWAAQADEGEPTELIDAEATQAMARDADDAEASEPIDPTAEVFEADETTAAAESDPDDATPTQVLPQADKD